MRLQELGHHSNHEIEKTDGLDESETQNGVGEELTTHAWVTGNGLQKSSEDETDTDTGTGKTDSGTSHTEILGNLDKSVGHFRGVWAAGGEAEWGGLGEDLAGLLTLDGLESGLGGLAHGSEGTLSTKVGANHWAGDLSGGRSHEGSHLRSNTSGHCIDVYEEDTKVRFWRWVCVSGDGRLRKLTSRRSFVTLGVSVWERMGKAEGESGKKRS